MNTEKKLEDIKIVSYFDWIITCYHNCCMTTSIMKLDCWSAVLMNKITYKSAILARSWRFEKNYHRIWAAIVWDARMSRGERFARPSVHRAINFGHKALPAREVGCSVLERGFSLRTLDIHASTYDRALTCCPSVQIYPSTLSRLNRECQWRETWIEYMIKKERKE